MSKSKGNVIAPSDIQDKYGTDALRMGLIVNNVPGTDMNLDPDKVNAYRKFANKIWNISRFVLDSTKDIPDDASYTVEDAANLQNNLQKNVELITKQMNDDRFDIASEKLYHFIWDYFASELLEESKPLLQSDDLAVRSSRQRLLREYLVTSIKLLHPYMPFVTEAVWQRLPEEMKETDFLMVAKWPTINS